MATKLDRKHEKKPWHLHRDSMTFKKRPVLVMAMLVGLVCAVPLILINLPAWPGSMNAKFDRIEVGMSHEDVDKAVGLPSDSPARAGVNLKSWCGQRESFSVYFDDQNRVRGAVFHDRSSTMFERLVQRLRSFI
jgi:hypothetical protein